MTQVLTIVGGGITGLVSALLAARAGRKVRVIEASPYFGGLLNTFEIGGTRLEHFYHHFFTHDAEIHWLIQQLGISDRLEYYETSMGVYRGGKVYPFSGPKDLLRFKPITWSDKFRFALSSLYLAKVADWRRSEDVAAIDWFARYAGRSSTDSLWRPMLNVKFGPFAGEVPLAWMIGRLRQRMNSRTKGAEKLGYLRGSLSQLLEALLGELRRLEVELIANAPVASCHIEGDSLMGLATAAATYTGGDFLLTVPSPVIAKLLADGPSEEVRRHAAVRYFGAICVILEMNEPLSDTYWLNVADPGFPFGGVIEHTNLVPPSEYNNRHITYLSRYVTQDDPLLQQPESAVAELMIAALCKIYPKFRRDSLLNVHVFRTRTAATVCDRNFSRLVPQCRSSLQHCYIANMCHIYPDERSVNNSIRVAAEACQVMNALVDDVPSNMSLSAQIGFH